MKGTDVLNQFLLFLEAKGRKRKTLIGYHSDMKRFGEYWEATHNCPWDPHRTTRRDVEAFFDALKLQGLQPASLARVQYCLRSFTRFAHTKLGIENFMSDIEQIRYTRKEREYLTKEEAFRFIATVEHPVVNLFARTLYYTGLRIAEACNLRIKHVDLNQKLIRVYYDDEFDRTVPISSHVEPYLRDYRYGEREYAGVDEHFFATSSGAISPSYVTRIFDQANVFYDCDKKVTAHTFRHTFASRLIQEGVHVVIVQRLLGHKDLNTTMQYAHTYSPDLYNAVNKL